MSHSHARRVVLPILLALSGCGILGDDNNREEDGSAIAVAKVSADVVAKNGTLTLDGSGSYDPEGEAVAYEWRQISGPAARITDTSAAITTVTAPARSGVMVFQLTVDDGWFSPPTTDTVTVTVLPSANAPVANAGANTTVNGGEPVYLDSSASTDADGEGLVYHWKQIAGTRVTLDNPNSARPGFLAPNVDDTLQFEVAVSDGDTSSSATVDVNTLAYNGGTNALPVSPFRPEYKAEWLLTAAANGNFLYAGVTDDGIHILDISDPEHPTKVASFADGATSSFDDFEVQGSYLYTASNGTFAVYNIASPLSPVLKGSVAGGSGERILDQHVAGTVAYLHIGSCSTCGSDYIEAVDIADPTAPKALATYPVSKSVGYVAANNNYLYIPDRVEGLVIVDAGAVQIPTTPALTHVLTLGTDAVGALNSLAFYNDHAYAAGEHGVTILDISNPASASVVGTIAAHGRNTAHIQVINTRLYFVVQSTLKVYDLASATAPVLVGEYDADSGITDYQVNGDYIWVGTNVGLNGIYAPAPSVPKYSQSITGFAGQPATAIAGNMLYVAAGDVLRIYDIRNPLAPTQICEVTDPYMVGATGIAVDNGYAYVANYWGNTVVDVIDPVSPKVVARLPNRSGRALSASDGYVYSGQDSPGLIIVDANNLPEPVTASTIALAAEPTGVAIDGDTLYVLEGSADTAFRVFDITDHAKPIQTGSLVLDGDKGNIVASGNYVYAANNFQGLRIIDVSNPVAPMIANELVYGPFGYGNVYRFALSAGYASFTTEQYHGLTIDLTDPLAASPPVAAFFTNGLQEPLDVFASIDRYLMTTSTLASGDYALRFNELQLTVDKQHVTATVGATLTYAVTWSGGVSSPDRRAKCYVTGGNCQVTAYDETNHTATIEWALPAVTGDQEIRIAIGNFHQFSSMKDRVNIR